MDAIISRQIISKNLFAIVDVLLYFGELSPQKSPTHPQWSRVYPQGVCGWSPIYSHKSPISPQKSLKLPQKRPIYPQKSHVHLEGVCGWCYIGACRCYHPQKSLISPQKSFKPPQKSPIYPRESRVHLEGVCGL